MEKQFHNYDEGYRQDWGQAPCRTFECRLDNVLTVWLLRRDPLPVATSG